MMNIVSALRDTFEIWGEEATGNLRRNLAAGVPVFIGEGCACGWTQDGAG